MKGFRRFLAVLLCAVFVMGVTGASTENAYAAAAPAGLKGVWVSFLDWQIYLKGKDQASFDASFSHMCDNTLAHGLNSLFVHVRSHNDAVYPSGIYPWSTEMLNGNPGFDPLADMVAIAHSKGLTFHAWINPYGFRNGAYSGNAALANHNNIVAGVTEIVTRYAVDGIHFDDYFPPVGKPAVNAMVAAVHNVCASTGKVFGISPQGNLDNIRASSADADTWLSAPGYVDYLMPQIYWSDQYGAAANVTMYSNRIALFRSIDKAGIPLYVGLAGYRAGQALNYDPGWGLRGDNLATQVDKARAQGYTGYCVYRYSTLDSPAAAGELANLATRG
ncbi:MAG: family 10 glycosylhydrolase [Lachnospiraceae bacterium]|nr:family 10 glycosylhydrolase [Lachnospiraceae bacterium]